MLSLGKYRENLGKKPKSDVWGSSKQRVRDAFPEEVTDDLLGLDSHLEEVKAAAG